MAKRKQELSSGLSMESDDFVDSCVTPLERRLYFSTALFHLRGGCPALAVEVLSKLPPKVIEANLSPEATKKPPKLKEFESKSLATGTFDQDDWLQSKSDSSDWMSPQKGNETAPAIQEDNVGSGQLDMDWSQPVTSTFEEELKLEWSDDPDTDEDDEGVEKKKVVKKVTLQDTKGDLNVEDDEGTENPVAEGGSAQGSLDIMAQQLKFIACLKIMMEELSTLATGFEVDGGLLR